MRNLPPIAAPASLHSASYRRCAPTFVAAILLAAGFCLAPAIARAVDAPAVLPDPALTPDLPNAPIPNASLPDTPEPNLPRPARTDLAFAPAPAWNGLSAALDSSSSVGEEASEAYWGGGSQKPSLAGSYVPLKDCPTDTTRARECRMHWKPLWIEASIFNAFQNTGNLYTGYWYRYETMTGKWWDRYVNSVEGWRWNVWKDNNPFLDDYIGHPMMGAITNSIWIQNDPKGMTLEQANNWPYWRSRLRAFAWSTFYSFEWKLGPFGEAGIGHNGDHFYTDKGTLTNETGWVELVTTPFGGLAWTLAEDFLDKHVVRAVEQKTGNVALLTLVQFLTPARGFANILRFRPPWYRDSRVVEANSFFRDPWGGVTASTADAMRRAKHDPRADAYLKELGIVEHSAATPSNWEGPGGRHEFGIEWGLSLMTGHVFGYESDVKYMPVNLRYSYEVYRYHQDWSIRYSPEVTAIAMLDWPTPQKIGKGYTGTVFNQRTREYGSGVSPVGFEMIFRPTKKVQLYYGTDGGFIYYADRVLSPQGSQFMYTIGPDVGISVYRHGNQSVNFGWRYTHQSNANISLHNPGTDSNVFYIGVSRYRSKGN